jgi:hypothetical protein
MAFYALGRESELLHFIQKAKARRPAATYPAPTASTVNVGRYYLATDPADWASLGSLATTETATLAAIS